MIRVLLVKTLEKHASKWVVLAIDLVIVVFNFLLSYAIRLSIQYDFFTPKMAYEVFFVSVLSLLCFLVTGSFKGVIRQTGSKDIYKLAIAISMIWVITYTFIKINRAFFNIYTINIPISVVNLYSFLSFVTLVVSRILFKYAYSYVKFFLGQASELKSQKILIFGNGDEGVRTLKTIVNNSEKSTTVVGFVDDDKSKIGRLINGIKVYHLEKITPAFLAKKRIEEVVISNPDIKKDKLNEISDFFIELGIRVKIVPNYKDWINGRLEVSQIKQIQIEDLLDRSPILIENKKIELEYHTKTVFVTGAAGSIGSELVNQLLKFNVKQLILIDISESPLYDLQQNLLRQNHKNFKVVVADIRSENSLRDLFCRFKPDMIFHAAAYKHVPLMEEFPTESVKTNIQGTYLLATLAIEYKVGKFVFISTDKAVNPTNVMGATKRVAEICLQNLHEQNETKFVITRFGNVLGSNGSVIPLFKKQIENGGPITVTHKEITRYFMTIPEASQLVIEAGAMANGGEVYVFDMGQPVKIYDLAKRMIKLSGFNYPKDIDIDIVGLRPGEKLYEELLTNTENSLPTYHKKIMISKPNKNNNLGYTAKLITSFLASEFEYENEFIIQTLKKIVPEYTPKNSIFKGEMNKIDYEKINFNFPLAKRGINN